MAMKIIENENTIKKISKKHKIHNFIKTLSVTAMTAAMFAVSAMTVFAANDENAAPENISTDTMSAMINIIMWIVRIAILAIGGIPGLIKIVQGQQEENPRDRNNGIVSVVIAGVAFAATFAIAALINP